MKKLCLILSLILIIPSFCSCSLKNSIKINVYFKTKDYSLAKETRFIKKEDVTTAEKAKFALNCIIGKPTNPDTLPVAPENLRLLSIGVDGNTVKVNFSNDYYKLTGVDELVFRYALVNTLCEIDDISSIQILVDSNPLLSQTGGTELGVISKYDMISDLTSKSADTILVKLYFKSQNENLLDFEQRVVTVPGTKSVEKSVVTELLKGSTNPDLANTIPTETKLIDIEVKDGGVCFVNLSKEFLEKASTDFNTNNFAIYSIVNSLTELPDITSVQFMIEGKTNTEYGTIKLDEPFLRNEDFIKRN